MHPKSPWWLVAGVFLVLAVSSGFGFHNLSVYMNALAAEREFAVAEISGAVGLMFLVGGVSGVFVGRWIEGHDIRWVMVGGAAIGGLALSAIGAATEIWQVFALYAVFGIGNSGVSLIPATTVITRWFPGANRSLALSVASTGLSVGGVLLTPLSAQVVYWLGIAEAMAWFGICYFAAIAPIAALMVRSWPTSNRPRLASEGLRGVGGALRSRFFIGATVAYMAIMASQVGGIAHVFNHVEKFTDHVAASLAVSAMGISSIVGRLLGGVMLASGIPVGVRKTPRRNAGMSVRAGNVPIRAGNVPIRAGNVPIRAGNVPIRAFTCGNLVLQAVGLGLFAGAGSAGVAFAGAVVFGLSMGNLLMLQPLLLAQAFGVARYPRLFAVANAGATLGVAGGPLAMGLLHDAASYATSFAVAAGASVAALGVFVAAGPLPDSSR